ncbi:MAG: RNA-binding transcriptional accessory protein [Chloroflexi bacterium]|nr:RNA-binding transcriptional accessory protein [Chloroflexota bacterium]
MRPIPMAQTIADEVGLRADQVERTVALFDEGNTIPFVARYRKEVTDYLDEEQLRAIAARLEYLRNLAARKETVLASIEEQGALTDDLRARIEAATVLQEVEDLYLPFKPKRRTRAMVAREKGLQPLADMFLEQQVTRGQPGVYAANYLNDQVATVEDALAGARDIAAEVVAEDADTRAATRQGLLSGATLQSAKVADAADPQAKYEVYYEYGERLASVPPHRLLAIRRGEAEGVLHVALQADDEALVTAIERRHVRPASIFSGELAAAIRDGYARLLRPSLEREIRAARMEEADDHAIRVFGANLRGLLLQAPLKGVRVLGLDPGLRTGCKVAVVDETGKFLAEATVYPHTSRNGWADTKKALAALVKKHAVDLVAIGNGTASRETEALVAEMIAEGARLSYVMVSEAGASVYSASPLARQELPGLDVSIRGAVSIARRLQDPLSELVKIEPKAIGVGLYQHDVDQKALAAALDAVVESAVNYVGVDVNTASAALLRYVAGISARVASAVVAHRDAHGPFRRRRDLLDVKGLGAKAYQQAAGFLRIPGGEEPLDNTSIHPESYAAAQDLLALMSLTGREADLPAKVRAGWEALQAQGESAASLAETLGVGRPTLEDMLANLLRPGRDPREDLPAPILRTDVLKMEDLREGMMLKGTVRNVVDFGAFVDIGVKQDGLVHISQLADHYVRDPLDVVSVGDIVDVRVISVDLQRGRIGLSMKE